MTNRKSRGYVLLTVILFMVLMASAVMIFSAQTRHFLGQTRLQGVEAELDNALASAAEWIKANPEKLAAMSNTQPVSLPVSELSSAEMECSCRLLPDSTVEITVIGHRPHYPARRTIRIEK
ncbi:MAG: hypothetical protein ABFD91_10640 [Anaerohalosphaeraceae bacterium]